MRKTENSEYKIRKYKAKQGRTASVFFVGGITSFFTEILHYYGAVNCGAFCQNSKIHKKSILLLETNAVFVV